MVRAWRHFQNLDLSLDDDVGLVCIVGANGTGKSHLLELIAACAHRVGLAQGVEIPRGDPFADEHDFVLQMHLAEGASDALDVEVQRTAGFDDWDRLLTISSTHTGGLLIEAGGVRGAERSRALANVIVAKLRESKAVHFVSLDADRAYPKKNINFNEVAQAYEIDWEGVEYTRGRSYRTTTALYDEWIKYFLAQENQSGTRLIQAIRRAREASQAEPRFVDHFEGYKSSLCRVLPHLTFSGVDSKKRTLLFDTTGMELRFDQLSGGEREIAFLVGQIDRFQLRHGLFLLDEPELHLNADLIRTWVAYLTGTVKTGQIWLATHSLEAVEAAGQRATFVLERNDESKKVDRLARLDQRPVLSALSRAVGTPAFSLSKLRFVFVEGEDGVGERERYRRLAGAPEHTRFMECGSCQEVVRRVDAIRALSSEAEGGLRIGGVVDRDRMTATEAEGLAARSSIFVLPVQEVENLFLHPSTLDALIAQNGLGPLSAATIVLAASDARAGGWIFQYAMATPNAKSLPDINSAAKDRAKSRAWSEFEDDAPGVINSILELAKFEPEEQTKMSGLLSVAARAYARRRTEPDLWKYCDGKEVLGRIAPQVGYTGVSVLVQAALALWDRDTNLLPAEVTELRTYIASL